MLLGDHHPTLAHTIHSILVPLFSPTNHHHSTLSISILKTYIISYLSLLSHIVSPLYLDSTILLLLGYLPLTFSNEEQVSTTSLVTILPRSPTNPSMPPFSLHFPHPLED